MKSRLTAACVLWGLLGPLLFTVADGEAAGKAAPPAAAAAKPADAKPADAKPANLKTQDVDYRVGQTVLQGQLVWDDARAGKRPGVLVVHEWWGLNAHAKAQAARLAKAGYVAFALDMYGKGKLAQHPKDAQAFVAEVTADAATGRARFQAALAQLKKAPQVEASQIAAIGYCFGGAVVLDMARAGEDLGAVVSFHGALGSKLAAKKGIKPRILVATGADDPMIGPDLVEKFRQEMTAATARFEIISYPGAKHSFTNPDADKAGVPGLAYNAAADQASWEAMLKLFSEVFPGR
jgi:dienelactone hydrolase